KKKPRTMPVPALTSPPTASAPASTSRRCAARSARCRRCAAFRACWRRGGPRPPSRRAGPRRGFVTTGPRAVELARRLGLGDSSQGLLGTLARLRDLTLLEAEQVPVEKEVAAGALREARTWVARLAPAGEGERAAVHRHNGLAARESAR